MNPVTRYRSPVRSRRLSPLRSRMGTVDRRPTSPVRVASPTRRGPRTVARPSPSRRPQTVARPSPSRRTTRAATRSSPARKARTPSPRRRSVRARARSSPRRGGKRSNPWIEFIQAHAGQGYTFKELSKMYRKR